MAQGVLERKQFNEQLINPAARSVADSLNAGRYQAWIRAKALELNRSVVTPVIAFRAWLTIALEPVIYKLWRFFVAFAGIMVIAASETALGVSHVALNARAYVQSIHVGVFKRVQSALLLAGFSVLVFTYGFYGMGLEVFVDGVSFGYVKSQDQFERAVASVSQHASEVLNAPFTLSPNATFRYSLVSRGKVFDTREVEDLLFSRIPDLKVLDVLTINGEAVAGVIPKGVIADGLAAMLGEASEGYDTVEFVQDVSITRQLAATSIEITPAELNEVLHMNLYPAVTAFAEEGTDIDDFASNYGLSTDRLLALNPTIEDISGQTLTISNEMPLLQVKATRKEVYTEVVAYETEYIEDSSMYKNSSRTLTAGVDGYNTVAANVSYIGGRESGREILEVENTLEPVTEVIAQGTLTPPTFIRPFYGKVTSKYGMRYLFGRTSMHTGVDFAGAIGSPIVASCDGTVSFSGTKSGYGLCIIIKHGNGLSTLYGHNSKLMVKVGDKVKQGQQIAKLGNTGRSTGPHVHFEVRVNDKPVNPFNGYIK